MNFTKTPGDVILPSTEDESMALIADDRLVPDTVTLPVELGERTARVLWGKMAPCPVHDHEVWTLALENKMFVAECSQFFWYQGA